MMLIELDANDPRPVFRQIADEVRRLAATGILRPNDPLPGVRALAESLKVNANTVQQAYRTLAHERAIYVRRGVGTFLAGGAPAAPARRVEAVARQIAGKMLREGFRHGVLASDLMRALQEVAAVAPRS